MKNVLFRVRDGIAQFTKFCTRRRRCNTEYRIVCFGGSQMVRPRTNAADTRDDTRKLLYRSSDTEFLEAAKLYNIDEGVRNVAAVIKVYWRDPLIWLPGKSLLFSFV
jgi:hypothetical protein